MSESADQKRTRRRWINIAELVGVAGLIIAALGLWSNWSDRRADQRDRQAERAETTRARTAVLLDGTVKDGGRTLALADASQKIRSVDVRFPASLGAGEHQTLVDPRIEADWIAAPLLALLKGDDAHEGRVPVLITADWWDADAHRSSHAIYDVVWKTEGRFLRGRALRLEGVVLRERGGNAARLEAIWVREKPKS